MTSRPNLRLHVQHEFEVRFLTTYDQTIFFKQEPHRKKIGKWVLWHSPVIRHTAHSQEISGNEKDFNNPALYRGKVSLRECFLYLVQQAYHNEFAENTMQFGNWVGKSRSVPKDDHISEASSSESGDDKHGSNPRVGKQQAPATGHEPRRKAGEQSMADITARTVQLTIDNQSRTQSPLAQDPRHQNIQAQNPRLYSQPQTPRFPGVQPQENRSQDPHPGVPWYTSSRGPVTPITVYPGRERHWYYETNSGPQYVDVFEYHTSGSTRSYFIQKGYRYEVRYGSERRR